MPGKSEEQFLAIVGAPRTQRFLKLAITLVSVFLAILFVYAAARRMRYAFELEWIESSMVLSIQRIAAGLPLYIKPTAEFTPYLYAPLYFYVSAALAKWFGAGYFTLRLVSILSTLGSFALIYWFVWSETKNRVASFAGVGLFAGFYAVTQACYDFGRVDALFTFLMLVALWSCRRAHPLVSAVAWVLVCQTKQSLLPIALFILVVTYWYRPKRAILAAVSFLALFAGSVLLMNHWTDGWYTFYVFGAARGLGILARQFVLFWPDMVLRHFPLGCAVIVAALVLTRPDFKNRVSVYYASVSFALAAGIWFVYGHAGASANALIPLYAWSSVLFGLAIGRLLNRYEANGGVLNQAIVSLLLIGVFIQLSAMIYNPGIFIPPPSIIHDRWALIDQVKQIPGDVYFINHNVDAPLAGKKSHSDMEAIGIFYEVPGEKSAAATNGLRDAVDQEKYSAVVADKKIDEYEHHLADSLQKHYPLVITAQGATSANYLTSQPRYIFLPCSALRWDNLSSVAPSGVLMDRTACPAQ